MTRYPFLFPASICSQSASALHDERKVIAPSDALAESFNPLGLTSSNSKRCSSRAQPREVRHERDRVVSSFGGVPERRRGRGPGEAWRLEYRKVKAPAQNAVKPLEWLDGVLRIWWSVVHMHWRFFQQNQKGSIWVASPRLSGGAHGQRQQRIPYPRRQTPFHPPAVCQEF